MDIQMAGPRPRVSDSVILEGIRKDIFITSSQVMLLGTTFLRTLSYTDVSHTSLFLRITRDVLYGD